MSGPDFLGIGAQKAATTWLFQRLSMHPEIYFPRGKEIHFWDRRDRYHGIGLRLRDRLRSQVRNYRNIFCGPLIDHIGGKTGEITPAYLMISEERIRELAGLAPELRLLVMLRHPVRRALSAAAQVHRDGRIDTRRSNPLRLRHTIEAGLYGKHLERWMTIFPRAQFHIVTHEDLCADPVAALRGTARHLGVDPGVYDRIDVSLLSAPAASSPNRIEADPADLVRLAEIYRPDVALLEALLERRFGWEL